MRRPSASAQQIVLDPSRMAAQIVSGIGFIGAGLIFVRRDAVRGLTTAASVWVTAAIGCAAGAGVAAGAYLVVVALAFPALTRCLPRSATAVSSLRVRYLDGRGVLRQLLQVVTSRGFTIDEVSTGTDGRQGGGRLDAGVPGRGPLVEVTLQAAGERPRRRPVRCQRRRRRPRQRRQRHRRVTPTPPRQGRGAPGSGARPAAGA